MAKIIEKIKNFFRIINLEKERIEKEKDMLREKIRIFLGILEKENKKKENLSSFF